MHNPALSSDALKKHRKSFLFKKEFPLYAMAAIPLAFLFVFSYIPMFGVIMAFEEYIPGVGWYVFGSPWAGTKYFEELFKLPDLWRVIGNTLSISVFKLIIGQIFPIIVALMLNEIRRKFIKRGIQTIIFIPYLISWVILSGIFVRLLSPEEGIFASIFSLFGAESPFFLGDNDYFPWVIILTAVWKGAGYNVVIFMAAIVGVPQDLYEAAEIDGAGRIKKMLKITVPCIAPTIILLSILALGNILNAGFEQVYNMMSPVVQDSGQILDTYVFSIGISAGEYSLSAAVGLFKSGISLVLIAVSYMFAYFKYGYKIF